MCDDSSCCGRTGQCETEPWAEDGPNAVRVANYMHRKQKPSTCGDYSAHTRRCLLPAAVEVYGDTVTTKAAKGPPGVAGTPAGALVTGVECWGLSRSKQAECCSWCAVIILIEHSKLLLSPQGLKNKKIKYGLLCVRGSAVLTIFRFLGRHLCPQLRPGILQNALDM